MMMMHELKAGAYKVDVTPPVGTCVAGTFSVVRASNILDRLYIHALVIDDGQNETALISADVCYLNTEFINNRMIPDISRCSGILPQNIMIAATHTHSGPVLHSTLPEVFGEALESYVDMFIKASATAVYMAKKRKKDVRVSAGKGKNENHVFNRRLKKPDGTIVMNFVESDFLKDCSPSGPVDPEVLVARFDDADGKPVAMVVNFANHNNTFCGQELFSASISGYMKSVLEKVYGDEMITIFLLGACGNTNWVDFRDETMWTDKDIHKKIGTGLAGTVLEIMPVLKPVEGNKVEILHEKLEIYDRPYCNYDTFEDDTFGRGALRKEFFDGYNTDKIKYEKEPLALNMLDICVMCIGEDLAIASNPAELFAEIGMEIKLQSPFKYTFISELTNGSCGYVPTAEAFNEGGYEVRKIKEGSYLDKNAGRKIADASLNLLKCLR